MRYKARWQAFYLLALCAVEVLLVLTVFLPCKVGLPLVGMLGYAVTAVAIYVKAANDETDFLEPFLWPKLAWMIFRKSFTTTYKSGRLAYQRSNRTYRVHYRDLGFRFYARWAVRDWERN